MTHITYTWLKYIDDVYESHITGGSNEALIEALETEYTALKVDLYKILQETCKLDLSKLGLTSYD